MRPHGRCATVTCRLNGICNYPPQDPGHNIKVLDISRDGPLVCPVQPRKTARKMLVVTSLIKEWTDEVEMERHAVEGCS